MFSSTTRRVGPFRVFFYQKFSLFGAGRPEIPAAVVVDGAVRRFAVDLLGILDVDLLVVHVYSNGKQRFSS